MSSAVGTPRPYSGIEPTLLFDSGSFTDLQSLHVLRSRLRKSEYQTAPWTYPEEIIKVIEEDPTTATTGDQHMLRIRNEIRALFERGKEVNFEDGMESDFSRQLIKAIEDYSEATLKIIKELILKEKVNTHVVSEALRWLGYIDHPTTFKSRFKLLEQCLEYSSVRVRDAALLGLSYMDTPLAIPKLREAIDREPCVELREDIAQVLAQLESDLSSATSPKSK